MLTLALLFSTIVVTSADQPAAEPRAPVIHATGTGRPSPRHPPVQAHLMARRAAEVVAVRNAGRQDGQGNLMFVRGFQYLQARTHADGSVEVTVQYQRTPVTSSVVRYVR